MGTRFMPFPEKWKTDIRLSPKIKPVFYDLLLDPSLQTGRYTGKVSITVDVEGTQDYIALHAKGLNITKCLAFISRRGDLEEIKLKDAFEYKPNEFWVIIPEDPVYEGQYVLIFDFEGSLKGKIVGFYQSHYTDDAGQKRTIVTSKFEPTFSRQAFPCFDEPGFKSRFKVQLVKQMGSNLIALSNTGAAVELPNDPEMGKATVTFNRTVPMSTYLLCFIICDFGKLDSLKADGGFPVSVYARKNQVKNMEYAMYVAKTVVNHYQTYFKIRYPLEKLDLIAIPDFVSGAMENWGLITFRETSVLYNRNVTSTANKLRVSQTVAHEVAHMWFGNLVTMKWWNDLWLNEGYASFMEYKGVAVVHPDWDMDAMFLIHDLHSALELDSTLNSHPIVQEVTNPDQITEIFDRISYNKGASVIRMLEAMIGEESFREGVCSYMKAFQYKNAETKDLCVHIQKFAPHHNVSQFMDTWTRQMGYPLIRVSKKGTTLTFEQTRYLADPLAEYDETKSPFLYRWDVPITYITPKTDTPGNVWLSSDKSSVTVEIPEDVKWIKANVQQTGYYRVNYDHDLWKEIIRAIINSPGMFHVNDRANLLNDAFSLAEAEIVPYHIPLKLTNYLPKETHCVPWVVASSEFSTLKKRLLNTEAYDLLLKFVQLKMENKKDMAFTFTPEDSFLQKYLKTTLFHLGCAFSHSDYISNASYLFKKFLDKTIKLGPDITSTVLYYGIQNGNKEDWEALWNMFIKEQNPQENVKMMVALTASKDPAILQGYLQRAKSEDVVRSQDFLSLLATIGHNPTGSDIVWDFVRNEWSFLVDRYTLNSRNLGNMVASITSDFATVEKLEEMKQFFSKYPDAGAGTISRKQALEKVELNIKWRTKFLQPLTDWLQQTL